MTDSNRPAGPAESAPTFSESVEQIATLLPDSLIDDDANPGEEEKAKPQDGDDPDRQEAGPDDAAADDEQTADEEEPDGSADYSKGRFAADDAKVTLNDGSVVTITDLKRGFMSQQAFTRKTQEHAERVKTFEAESESSRTLAQNLSREREFLFGYLKDHLGEEPDASLLDPTSDKYDPVRYSADSARYNRTKDTLARLWSSMGEAQKQSQAQQEKEQRTYIQGEREKLQTAMPGLKTREGFDKFMADAVKTMESYGFTESEVRGTIDHRFFLVMQELAQFRRVKAKAPQVAKDVQGKPKLIQGGKRQDPKQQISRQRQERAETLRKTGTIEAGVAALSQFDL